jgi:hypothetical protein
MSDKTENEIVLLGFAAAKELHEIIAAAKQLGIKLTDRSGYGEFVERYNADDGDMDEGKVAIEDANGEAASALPCGSQRTSLVGRVRILCRIGVA